MLGRGLLKEFPNPQRVGCPGADVLKRIASHEMPLSEAEKWLDHLGSCSPCYADFKRLREAHEARRRRTWLAVAASILLVAAISAWALLRSRNENLTAQTAILDLRDRSPARGTEMTPEQPALEVSRRTSDLIILLPLGSSEGSYEVRIVTPSGELIVETRGAAKLTKGLASLQVLVNLDSVRRGQYLLQVRKPESEWSSYPLRLK